MSFLLARCCVGAPPPPLPHAQEEEMAALFSGPGAPLPPDQALQLLQKHMPLGPLPQAFVDEVARLCDALSVRVVHAAATLVASDEDGVPAASSNSGSGSSGSGPRARDLLTTTNHRICQCAKLCQIIAQASLRDGGHNATRLLVEHTPGGVRQSRVLSYLLVEVLNSPCRELRAEVSRVLGVVVSRAPALCRLVVYRELQHILVAVAWEQQWHRGVREVLAAARQLMFDDALCVPPRTLAWALEACVLPLHRCRAAYRACAECVADIVAAACARGVLRPSTLVATLRRHRCWQNAPTDSQVLMLGEVQRALDAVLSSELGPTALCDCRRAVVMMAGVLALAVRSNCAFVCERALALVRAPFVLTALVEERALPPVLLAVVRTSEEHWDTRTRAQALVTLQHVRRTDNDYVNEIVASPAGPASSSSSSSSSATAVTTASWWCCR